MDLRKRQYTKIISENVEDEKLSQLLLFALIEVMNQN
jgi:hypothetical protein